MSADERKFPAQNINSNAGSHSSPDSGLFVDQDSHLPKDSAKVPIYGAELSSDEDGDDDEILYDKDGADEEFKDKLEEERNGLRKNYDTYNERPPNLPAYHESFAKVEKACEELFAGAEAILKASDYTDEYTQTLLQDIAEKQAVQYPEAKKVGIVGDGGVGKSSLINALLNTPYLAPRGGGGQACTCVITEYMQAPQTQLQPFQATIEILGPEELESMLAGHLEAYYKYFCVPSEGLEGDALQLAVLEASTARDVLRALFVHRTPFRTKTAAQAFLATASSAKDKNMLKMFTTWMQESIALCNSENSLITVSGNTCEDIVGQLDVFVTNRSSVDDEEEDEEDEEESCFSLWPIVKVVKVGLQSALLARGLIIVDVPGLSDVDQSRTKMTSRYIRECLFYVIVAPIARILTNRDVHFRLMQLFRRPGIQKMLIVTKIDDMPLDTRPRTVGVTSLAVDNFRRLFKALNLASDSESRLDKSMQTMKGRKKKEANILLPKLTLKRRLYESLVLQSLVRMQNQKVRRDLRSKYLAITQEARRLQIACVSSTHYDQHVEADHKNPRLSIDLTGIPNLRDQLSTLPAQGRLKALEHQWKGNLKSLLDSLNGWSHQSALHRHGELKKIVAKPCQKLDNPLAAYIEELKGLLESRILRPLERHQNEWKIHGLKASANWGNMASGSFNAWCKKYGAHQTKKYEYRNWNTELLEPIAKDIHEVWQAFDNNLAGRRDVCLNNLCGLVDGIETDLKGSIGGSMVKRRKQIIREAMEKGEPFSKICSGIKESIEQSLDEQRPILLKTAKSIFDKILKDFDLMFVVEELPDPRRNILRRQVQQFVLSANEKYHGTIVNEFAKATMGTT